MASHPIIWVMTSLCMLAYVCMIREVLRILIYIPRFTKKIYKNVVCIRAVHNRISCPPMSQIIYVLKRFQAEVQTFICLNTPGTFICTPILYLFTASLIYSYSEFILNLAWYCCFCVWFMFTNVYICVFFIVLYINTFTFYIFQGGKQYF